MQNVDVSPSIVNLRQIVEGLCPGTRAAFERVFSIDVSVSELVIPHGFKPKVARWFSLPGDTDSKQAIDRAERQTIVKVLNKHTLDCTLFNSLRAMKPLPTLDLSAEDALNDFINKNCFDRTCDFCVPLGSTPCEVWGRLESEHCLTAANVARGDCHHGLLIFRKHHPMEFGVMEVRDITATFVRWCARVQESLAGAATPELPPSTNSAGLSSTADGVPAQEGGDGGTSGDEHGEGKTNQDDDDHEGDKNTDSGDEEESSSGGGTADNGNLPVYGTMLWNCMPKAGASQPHGHAQMTLTKEYPGKAMALQRTVARYNARKPKPIIPGEDHDYFYHWVAAHDVVGLARHFQDDVTVLASLTPAKERELYVIGPMGAAADHPVFQDALFAAVRTLIDNCGTRAFNVVVHMPAKKENQKNELPLMARLVDRGAFGGPSDVGAFEMFATPLVASDPFTLIQAFDVYVAKQYGHRRLQPIS